MAGFLLRYAGLHPEHNFLGVERLLGGIRKLERKAPRLGLTNLRGVRIEAAYLLRYLLPPGRCHRAPCLFPRSLAEEAASFSATGEPEFPGLAARVLAPGARVFLRHRRRGLLRPDAGGVRRERRLHGGRHA